MLQTVLCGAACAAAAYLLGSLGFSIVVTRLFIAGHHTMLRLPTRRRAFGKRRGGAADQPGDIKGVSDAVLGVQLRLRDLSTVLYRGVLCRFARHVYPVYFGFGSGRLLSVLRVHDHCHQKPVLILLVGGVFIVFLCVKMVSQRHLLRGVSRRCISVAFILWLGATSCLPCCAAVIGGLVIWLHRSNIQRIKNGTEYKFGRKKK